LDRRSGAAATATPAAGRRPASFRVVAARLGSRLRFAFGIRRRSIALGLARTLVAAFASPATAAAPAPPATPSGTIAVGRCSLGLFLFFLLVCRLVELGLVLLIGLVGDRRRRRYRPRCRHWPWARAVDRHLGAFEALVDDDLDRHAIALLDVGQLGALLVEQIDRRLAARAQHDPVAAPTRRFVLDDA